MAEYVLDHHLEGERARLELMSRLLDPMHRRHIEELGIRPGARTLEVGCGNGSISAWLAARVGPGGRAVAVDLDLSLVDAGAPDLELRRQATSSPARSRPAASTSSPRAPCCTTSPTPRPRSATSSPASRPGGAILLIEPDFLPVSVAEPPEVLAFWDGWLAWSREQGIDYHIGRNLAPRLARPGPGAGRGHGRDRRLQWRLAVGRPTGRGRSSSCAPRSSASGTLDDALVDAFLAHCADPEWWTQTIAFTAVPARAPGTLT